MSAHEFLVALTIVLCIAGVTTVIFQRLRQPVVLGYILAGVLIGPHVPFPVLVNQDVVLALSELGVILLMFGLGLEFNLGKLLQQITHIRRQSASRQIEPAQFARKRVLHLAAIDVVQALARRWLSAAHGRRVKPQT